MGKRVFVLWCLGMFLCCIPALAYAALPSSIRVVRDNAEYPPMEFHEKGLLTGFHVELVEAVATRLGITITWEEVPWKRALNMVETGKAEGITYIGKTEEREKWAIFEPGNILSDAVFSFLVNTDSKANMNFTGDVGAFLKDRTLLMVAGFVLPESVKETHPETYEAPKMSNLVDMLLAKRYEVALLNQEDFLNAYAGTETLEKLSFLEPPVSSFENYIAFSRAKNLQPLAEAFATEMLEFKKSQEYQELRRKYDL